jgi:hypothetical protein
MSDIHPMPLRGHDLPEFFPRAPRVRAHVYRAPDGWRWEHECSPGWWKSSDFPHMTTGSAYKAAVRHLKECCK